jgi:hypothetical protein
MRMNDEWVRICKAPLADVPDIRQRDGLQPENPCHDSRLTVQRFEPGTSRIQTWRDRYNGLLYFSELKFAQTS